MKLIRILTTEPIYDSQHDGEIIKTIINSGKGSFVINPGMKIAQIIIQKNIPVNVVHQNE